MSASIFSTWRSESRINKIGNPGAFSRKDWQIRFPLARKDAALTTTTSGRKPSLSRAKPSLPLETDSTTKPFYARAGTKQDGLRVCPQ